MISTPDTTILDADQLRRILPQDYPFLMIDRVVHFEKNKSLTAVKNITGTEWFFRDGKDTDTQTMPPMLLIEAAAQAGLVLCKMSVPFNNAIILLSKFSVEFNAPLTSGQYFLNAIAGKFMSDKGFFDVEITDNRQFNSRASFFYSLRPNV